MDLSRLQFVDEETGEVRVYRQASQVGYNLERDSAQFFVERIDLMQTIQKILLYEDCWFTKEKTGARQNHFRTVWCLKSLLNIEDGEDDIKLFSKQYEAGNHVSVGNLMRCGSVWLCPFCSSKICAQRSELVEKAIEVQLETTKCFMVTLTLRHSTSDALVDLKMALLDSWRSMCQTRDYRQFNKLVVGSLRTLEVTHTGRGWHPHLHIVYASNVEIDFEFLGPLWSHALSRHGIKVPERGVAVHVAPVFSASDYLAKFGQDRGWHISKELTASALKSSSLHPFGIAQAYGVTGDSKLAVLFREYAHAFKGLRQLTPTGVFRGVTKSSDEELANAHDVDANELESLSFNDFSVLRKAGLFSTFIQICKTEGRDVAQRVVNTAHTLLKT